MGKKVNQASLKISKNEKQQFSSLIKVLRPKVYITDSSSFKKLVQELTGNGSSTSSSPPPLPPKVAENWPLMEAEVQPDLGTCSEVSVSTKATANSSNICHSYQVLPLQDAELICRTSPNIGCPSTTICNTEPSPWDVESMNRSDNYDLCYAALMNEEFNNQQVCNQICLDTTVLEDSTANHPLDYLMAYQNLESVLFDVEPNPLYDCFADLEQEVSLYDYELSGLL